MLDISILNADKATTNHTKLQDFMSKEYKVTEKFDGTKLTLWRNNENWNEDYTKNWVVSFKNQILYREEFEDIDREDIKHYSVGISQYALVHDFLEQHHINNRDFPNHFPLNTEVFIEFIQNKLTTTRDYHQKFDLFLIASTPATAEIVGGMIKTTPYKANHKMNNTECSRLLDIALPPVVFEGKMDTMENFELGMKSWGLMAQWETHKHSFLTDPYNTLKLVFLGFESCLGGKTEGVVLEAEDAIYKFVQADQYDKEVRFARKSLYQGTPEIETEYWNIITETAEMYAESMNYQLPLPVLLKSLNNIVYGMDKGSLSEVFKNKIEGTTTISSDTVLFKTKDDLFLTAKQMILDRLPENQNALFIGKFRIPTKAHIQIIENALEEYPHVVVCIVKAKKEVQESLSFDLQSNILTSFFGDSITIITHSTGNLTSIINKSPKRLRYILAGSDRVDSYEGQLKRHPSLSVVETKRKEIFDEEVSATRAITSIKQGDLDTFKNLVSEKTYSFLPKIQEEFQI